MPRLIPGPAAIGFCWLTRNTEVPDQSPACRQFLFILREADCLACGVQSGSISAVQAVGHGTAPLVDRSLITGTIKTVPFECCIIGVFDNRRISQGLHQPAGEFFSVFKVNDLHGIIVPLVSKQEDLKIWRLSVLVGSGFPNINAAPCLNINTKVMHIGSSLSG